MTISNWDSVKNAAKSGLPIFLTTTAIIFLICSFTAFWNGSVNYKIQTEQLNWEITNAEVYHVSERIVSSNGKSHMRSYEYDIYYRYTVDGQSYTGVIEDQNSPQNIGDTFEIKYNPESPEESTHILEPSRSYIVSGSVFGGTGLALVILSIVLIKRNKCSDSAKENVQKKR